MKDSKLIQLLKTLTKEEWKEFEKFVESPYFNKGRNYLPLLNKLKKYSPEFESSNLTRENIYKSLYPGKKFKETVIFTLTAGLYKLAEEFLTQIRFNSNINEKQLTLLSELQLRNLDNIFSANSKKLLDRLKNDKVDMYTFKYLEKFYELTGMQQMQRGSFFEIVNTSFENFREYSVVVFIIIIAKHLQNASASYYSANTEYSKSIVNTVVNDFDFRILLSKIKDVRARKLCEIYICLIEVYKYDKSKYYFDLKNKFFENIEYLNIDELLELMICLTNVSAMYYSRGKKISRRESFELYKKIVESNVFSEYVTDYRAFLLFRITVEESIIANELVWAENFVKEYSDKLNPELKENAYNYSMALIQFERKNFDGALCFASKVKFLDVTEKINLRNLMLKIYFELNYFEEFLSFCDAYKHFLNDNKLIIPLKKDRMNGLIKYSTQLLKIKNQLETEDLDYISKEIENEKMIAHKDWLLEKVDELRIPGKTIRSK